jgi:hypothetical protein
MSLFDPLAAGQFAAEMGVPALIQGSECPALYQQHLVDA